MCPGISLYSSLPVARVLTANIVMMAAHPMFNKLKLFVFGDI